MCVCVCSSLCVRFAVACEWRHGCCPRQVGAKLRSPSQAELGELLWLLRTIDHALELLPSACSSASPLPLEDRRLSLSVAPSREWGALRRTPRRAGPTGRRHCRRRTQFGPLQTLNQAAQSAAAGTAKAAMSGRSVRPTRGLCCPLPFRPGAIAGRGQEGGGRRRGGRACCWLSVPLLGLLLQAFRSARGGHQGAACLVRGLLARPLPRHNVVAACLGREQSLAE